MFSLFLGEHSKLRWRAFDVLIDMVIFKDSVFNRQQVFVLLDHGEDIRSQIRLSRKVESNTKLYQIAVVLSFWSYKAHFDAFPVCFIYNLASVLASFQYVALDELFSFISRGSFLAFELLGEILVKKQKLCMF